VNNWHHCFFSYSRRNQQPNYIESPLIYLMSTKYYNGRLIRWWRRPLLKHKTEKTQKNKKKTFCPGIVKMFLTRYTTRRIVITELLLLLLLLYQNLIFIRPSCVCVCVHHLIRGHRIYIYIYNNTRTGWRKENRAVNLRSSRQGETKDKKTKKKTRISFFCLNLLNSANYDDKNKKKSERRVIRIIELQYNIKTWKMSLANSIE
jgi:hypothetical protein